MRWIEAKVESTKGTATVSRTATRVMAKIEFIEKKRGITLDAPADEPEVLDRMARGLQYILDGRDGTNGDVAGYRNVLSHFED